MARVLVALDLRGNRYAPSAQRSRELCAALTEAFEPSGQALTMIELHGDDPRSDLCRALEQSVFDDAFGAIVPHTPDMMAAEYGPYEDRSRFLTAVESSTMSIVGTLRIIEGYPNKTTTDLVASRVTDTAALGARYHFDDGCTWDIGSVAVDKSFRRTLRTSPVSVPLYRALYVSALREGITDWTSVIDVDVLAFYKRLGIPFERLMELDDVNYLGSQATACYLDVGNIQTSMSAAAELAPRHRRATIEAILHGSVSIPEIRSRPQVESHPPKSATSREIRREPRRA